MVELMPWWGSLTFTLVGWMLIAWIEIPILMRAKVRRLLGRGIGMALEQLVWLFEEWVSCSGRTRELVFIREAARVCFAIVLICI